MSTSPPTKRAVSRSWRRGLYAALTSSASAEQPTASHGHEDSFSLGLPDRSRRLPRWLRRTPVFQEDPVTSLELVGRRTAQEAQDVECVLVALSIGSLALVDLVRLRDEKRRGSRDANVEPPWVIVGAANDIVDVDQRTVEPRNKFRDMMYIVARKRAALAPKPWP